MKHYRLNQIAMAVLGALLLFFGTRTLIDILYEEHAPEKPGLEVATDEKKPAEEEKPAAEAAGSEVIALLATADPKQGDADAALCKVCHSFDKGGGALIGPPLHDVVGRKIASVEGFNYSPALKDHGGDWTYENLDAFLANPQAFAPGTIMAFPGVPEAKKRADIIAFLRSETENPPPLPEAAPAAAPEAAEPAPAEEAPAAEPEAPAAEPEAPAAEEPAPAAEPEAPAAAEEPAAPEEPKEEPKAEEEAAPAAEPSAGEAPNPNWPQPVVPDEPAEPAEGPASSAGDTSGSPEASSSPSEDSNPNWPQPVYPDGSPN